MQSPAPAMALIHCYCSSWGITSWGTALLGRTWGAGEQQSVHATVLQHGRKEGQQYLGLYNW